jgi:hypothetical protein
MLNSSDMARAYYNRLRLDRKVTAQSTHAEAEQRDRAAWRRMTPRQRLEIVETLRQLNHADYDPATTRLSRVYTVTQPTSR